MTSHTLENRSPDQDVDDGVRNKLITVSEPSPRYAARDNAERLNASKNLVKKLSTLR